MTPRVPASIDEYLAAIPSEPSRRALERLRELIREVAPDAQEVISYGLPGFKRGKSAIWIGAFKKHCSLFAGHHVAEFEDRLAGYKISKGTIQFPPNRPLDDDLVKEIVAARLRA